MLMIFLMAILSLDLIRYSNQNRNSDAGQQEARAGYGLYKFTDVPVTETYRNATLRPTTTVATVKKTVKPRKRKASHNDTASSHSSPQGTKKPSPKSDMQAMPFYAQPMATFDINYHPPIYENYNPLVTGILNMNDQPLYNTIQTIPTAEPIPFKTLPSAAYDQYQNLAWNVPQSADRGQKIPIYDPFNVLKRKPVRPVRLRPLKVAPKLIPLRPLTPTTTLPPITVTHIFKYEESDSGLKLPFASHEDSFVENFPAITAALGDHLDGPANVVRVNGYAPPPKLPPAVIYEMPTLEPVFRNEFDILHKFNEAIKTQTQNGSPPHNGHQSGEYEDTSKEAQDDKNYTDEDVKKALHYIRNLKNTRTPKPNRGSKKFNGEKSENKKRDKGKDAGSSEENFEDDDERRKKRPKSKPESFEDDDNFKIKSFEELDEGESKRKIVKTEHPVTTFTTAKPVKSTKPNKSTKPMKSIKPTKPSDDKKNAASANPYTDDQIPYQESQIVPTLDHEDQMSPPDFSQNTELGGASNEDRVEFQMHGLRGPESYKFGYDTGKGENRQFRYEERDPDGRVKGHFGYYDKDGKMQVFNYEADPEHGYHLEQAHP